MRSPLKEEVSFGELRARYAELLRLRERVERLENLRNLSDEKATPIETADFIQEAGIYQ